MSEMGWNSVRSVATAWSTVCWDQGWPNSAASVRTARTGVAATPPAPIEASATSPCAMRRRSTRQTAEMSSS